MVKNPPEMQETWVHPWVGKIPWRRAWQPTLVLLPGESPWTEEPEGLQSMGSQRVRHNWDTKHNIYTHRAIFSFDPTFVVVFVFIFTFRKAHNISWDNGESWKVAYSKLLGFFISSPTATKCWICWRPPLQTCQTPA